MYTYCTYELRLSEDAAFRRARATKLARQFPAIFQHIADGELQLSTLLLLAPHLTEANHTELLALAKYRTKREVQRLVRCLSPEHDVPDRVEPLGPGPSGLTLPSAPSRNQFAESFAPSVRELPHGDRPKDWVDSPDVGAADAVALAEVPAPVHSEAAAEAPSFGVPQRYRVEFTASQEYADLLERAQDLLSHAVPSRSLEDVHLRALRLLVEKLERRKYGAPRTDSVTRGMTATTEPQAPAASKSSAMTASVMPAASKKHAHTRRQRASACWRRCGGRCGIATARGGQDSAENLTLHCQAHNALAAEQDVGRSFIQRQQDRHRQGSH